MEISITKSESTGIVHLWDLPHKQIYIKLRKEYYEKLIRLIHKLFNNSHKEIGKAIDEKSYMISCLEHGKTAKPLFLLIKLYKMLNEKGYREFTLENLEKQIDYIKAKGTATILYNPKLPFNFNSPAGGRIISAVLHDGSLTGNRFTYANNSEILKEKVYAAIKEVFGDIKADINSKRLRPPKIVYYALVNGLKMPAGEKTIENPSYPDFIFNSPSTWGRIIDQAISDDGWIQKKQISIVITVDVTEGRKEPQILLGDKKIFEKLGINVNKLRLWKKYKVNKNNKVFLREQWHLSISGKENLEKISKIGISHLDKQIKLERNLKSYKQDQYCYGENINKVLEACKKLKEQGEEITKNNVAKLIKRHPWRTSQILRQLIKLEKIKETRLYENKFTPALYDFVK